MGPGANANGMSMPSQGSLPGTPVHSAPTPGPSAPPSGAMSQQNLNQIVSVAIYSSLVQSPFHPNMPFVLFFRVPFAPHLKWLRVVWVSYLQTPTPLAQSFLRSNPSGTSSSVNSKGLLLSNYHPRYIYTTVPACHKTDAVASTATQIVDIIWLSRRGL